MPNWCNNRIRIYHSNKDELKKLYDNIIEWSSKTYVPNGFLDTSWLGNVVGNSGIDSCTLNTDFKVSCRGTLNNIELCDGYISLDTDSAWAPAMKMWDLIVDKYLPDAEIIYECEESGCEIYVTNDPDLKNKYVFDVGDEIDGEYYESDWEASKEYVIESLQKILKTDETDLNVLRDMLDESDYEVFVHAWVQTTIDELD